MNFTQVACGPCWNIHNPDRTPVRAHSSNPRQPHVSNERCSWCDQPTNSGIYFRAHPNTVPFPQPEDE